MGKVNNKGNKQKNVKNRSKDKQQKRPDAKSTINKAKFKVNKLGGNKDKKSRTVNFAKNDYQKKKLQNKQFESIQNLNSKMEKIQDTIRNSVVENNFERFKSPEQRPVVDIAQAINAINSL